MYNIRDNARPNGLIEEILMSEIISLLNLFVRDNNIKISKLGTIDEIYNADCRPEFGPFSGKIRKNILIHIGVYLKNNSY
jgi:hypothetical protein